MLNKLENKRAGTKLAFYLKFLNAKKELFSEIEDNHLIEQLYTCPSCGQLTQSEGQCAFCRMISLK